MSPKARYVVFVVALTLNLLILMMRVLSDYAAASPAADDQMSMLTLLRRSDNPVSYFFAGGVSLLNISSGEQGNISLGDVAEVTAIHEPSTLAAARSGSSDKLSGFDAVLKCRNQSECIKPHLEITHDINVYFCKHTSRGGVRFYYLMRDGLHAHPRVKLLDFHNIAQADYIFYLPNSAPWHKSECNDTSFANRLIVLDEYDLHQMFAPFVTKEERLRHYPVVDNVVVWNFMYFKRSFVRRKDGMFHGFPHLAKRDIYPLTYSIAEAYIQSPFNQLRDIEILCTLRGSKKQSTRLRVQQNVQKYIDADPQRLANSVAEQLDGSSRKKVSHEYFSRMHRAKIVVTVNPAQWEGDFRLWEALSSGALVFVDPIMVPHPYPLVDGRHVVYFSQSNASDLHSKLDYYRTHSEEARRIALTGYLHVMTFHRTVNCIDYILRTAEVKKAEVNAVSPLPRYAYTGQYLVAQTKAQERVIKKSRLPGKYEQSRRKN